MLALKELGKRHDWFSLLAVYDPNVPRGVRIAAIGTATLSIAFFNALLYDLVRPKSLIPWLHLGVQMVYQE